MKIDNNNNNNNFKRPHQKTNNKLNWCETFYQNLL